MSNKKWRDEAIIAILNTNTGASDTANCSDVACGGLVCTDCPLENKLVTIGDVRAADPRTVDKPKRDASGDDTSVKQPSHYQLIPGLEAIEIIARAMTQEQFTGYCMGNILKYRLRAGKKSELAYAEKDLAKAEFYVELLEKYQGLCHDAE